MYVTLNRAARVRPAFPAVNGTTAIGQLFDGFLYTTPSTATNGQSTVAARFDLVEKDDRFEARIEMPGVDRNDIDVQIDGASVRVEAEVKRAEVAEGAKVLHSNRVSRSFVRNFTLPAEVNDAAAEAAYQDGVLTLTLPKKEVVAPKRLAIK